MGKIIYIMLFMLGFCTIFSQEVLTSKVIEVIELKEYLDNPGVIIYVEHNLFFPFNSPNRFIPTLNDVIKAEDFFDNYLYMLIGDNVKRKELLKSHLRFYYRQYFGFVKDNGEKIIGIRMFDKEHSMSSHYKEQVVGYVTDEPGPGHYREYYINLDRNEFDEHSLSLFDEYWFFEHPIN